MMKNYSVHVFLILLLSVTSCVKTGLEIALEAAGDNRRELEKVIHHYSGCVSDTLKLKAAKFLIENMPGHYCIYGEAADSFYRSIRHIVVATDMNYQQKMDSINVVSQSFPPVGTVVRPDIEVISAEYLIKNIDDAFEQWTGPVACYLSFDEFCEWLLPYKFTEYQPLDYWRDTLSVMFNDKISSDYPNDEGYNSAYCRAYWVNAEIRSKVGQVIPPTLGNYMGYPLYSSSVIHHLPFGDCFDYTYLAVGALRSHSIPAALDYLPQWGRGSLRHSWFSFSNDTGAFLCSPWGIDSNPGDIFHPWNPVPKVYRCSYSRDARREEYKNSAKSPLSIFDVFEKDVTDSYMSTTDPDVPLWDEELTDDWVYIASFNGRGWNIMDFGKRRGEYGHFQKMGRRMAYAVLGHTEHGIAPISYPIVIRKNGDVKVCCPDTVSTETVRLIRKGPLTEYVANLEHRLAGARIQASDYEDFRKAETLYTVGRDGYPVSVPLHSSKEYRYWRIVPADGSYGIMAELQFFIRGEKKTGRIIGSADLSSGIANVFDGRWDTYYESPSPDGNWYGIDFEEPVSVDGFTCIPRSDDNLIHIGDTYELLYWSRDGWTSLGQKTADDRILTFENVPSGAMFRLTDITRGPGERIFIYENGEQIWY